MNVALIHDWLNGMRGGEKVLEVLCDLFPDAGLYTLFYEPDRVSEKIRRMDVHCSVLQRFPRARKHYRLYLPLYFWAVGQFDLSAYDVVISSSHCAAKSVRLNDRQIHICYCHTPMRYIWEQYEVYFGGRNRWRLPSLGMRLFRKRLQRWDVAAAQRVHHFIANSQSVSYRIRRYYNRESKIVYPPVDTDFFRPLPAEQADYFLVVAALVPYKRVDLAIEAFNRLGRPLWVVGTGPERRRLERMAGPNVKFWGWVSNAQLLEMYNHCRALIFPGEEDFGITAVEAQACGRPVIAYRKGGVTESVLDRRTGLFFKEPTAESLCEAVEVFGTLVFDRGVIRNHAEQFGGDRCRNKLSRTIQRMLQKHGL
ncbi:MAG: glycosyltransferase [Candidatus Sumerlaeia bacterium]|nr:glycosyltransferase [Candidatus Sumerlaeia bacterium]